jgi:hypothetical protein
MNDHSIATSENIPPPLIGNLVLIVRILSLFKTKDNPETGHEYNMLAAIALVVVSDSL